MRTFPRNFIVFVLLTLLAACGNTPVAPTATIAPVTAPTETAEPVPTETAEPMDHMPMESTADPFDVSVAQYFMDTAGFHGIAETLAETKTIDPTYLSTVNRVKKVLTQATWPAELDEQAQDFIKSLEKFAAALEADNVAEAIEDADTVHDAQHELSHAIDSWLGEHAHDH